jgi:hypothetical protein
MPNRPQEVHIYSEGGEADLPAWWQRPVEAWGPGERLLAAASTAVADLRAAVLAELGYTCSAGISHTKLLAKLCSGLHKPAQQTMLPAVAVTSLLHPLPVPRLRALGGQFGQRVMVDCGVETVGGLAAVSLPRLQALYGDEKAQWLCLLARGIDDSPVEERQLQKSISCGKTFRGNSAIVDLGTVRKWLTELATEIEERVAVDTETNGRTPQLLTVHLGVAGRQGSISRSCPLRKTAAAVMAEDATALVRRWAGDAGPGWRITDMSMGASNFQPLQRTSLAKFFKPVAAASVAITAVGPHSEDGQQQQQQRDGGDSRGKTALDERGTGAALPASTAGITGTAMNNDCRDEAGPSGTAHDHMPPTTASGSTLGIKPPPAVRRTAAGDAIDETFLQQLPPEVRKELEEQLKFDAMKAKMGSGKPWPRPSSGSTKKRGAGSGTKGGPPPAGTQTLATFLKGKRPKT